MRRTLLGAVVVETSQIAKVFSTKITLRGKEGGPKVYRSYGF